MALPIEQQRLVQVLISLGPLSADEVASKLNESYRLAEEASTSQVLQHETAEDGSELMVVAAQVNKKLDLMGLSMRTVYSPVDKKPFWGIVNTARDAASRVGSKYSKPQLRFFFAVADALLEQPKLEMSATKDIGLDKGLSMAETTRTIHMLTSDKWLQITKRNQGPTTVRYGVRSLLELPEARSRALSASTGFTGATTSDDGAQAREEDEEPDDGPIVASRSRKRPRVNR